MTTSTRKGKAKEVANYDEDDPGSDAEAADRRPGRRRKPSQKQAEINEDKQANVKRKLDEMQKEYKKLKQKAKKLKTGKKASSQVSRSADNEADSSSNSSSLSPESEEEDEGVTSARKHQSAFQSRGIFMIQQPAKKLLRREGDQRSQTATTAPSTRKETEDASKSQDDTAPARGRSPARTRHQSLSAQEESSSQTLVGSLTIPASFITATRPFTVPPPLITTASARPLAFITTTGTRPLAFIATASA
ncbi:hypothetical protein OH77DRAFT_1519136 [Trametes cingulata]|nr:hypothetical protein OH77DRAFT_1519136 [Trametes cingulata]